MRVWLPGLMLLAAHAVCSGAETEAAIAADRALAGRLAKELKAELTQALQTSAENAIAVCNVRAPEISAKLSAAEDVAIGRTSLRVRNPANAPSAWQRRVLEDFQRRLEAGETADTLEYTATIDRDGYTERRYMKAIVTEPLCLVCHGQQLAPGVAQAIAAKYPNDAATGFSVGELRGAVYVLRRTDRP